MICFQKHAAAALVIVLSFLLLGCESNDHPSSSMLKHTKMEAVHVCKLLNLTADQEVTVEKRGSTTAPSECSQDAVVVSQAEAGLRPGGLPSYSVTITNTCLSCAVSDVHVSCGAFGSAKLVDPGDFRRVTAGDCLVRGGAAMRPGETISFEYANEFQYDLGVASVSCSCS